MLIHTKGKRGADKTDKIGMRFGRLLVVECIESSNGLHYGDPGSNKRGLWKCLCDCGTEKNIHGFSLISGKNGSKSCGCLQKEKARQIGTNKRAPDRVTYTSQYNSHRGRCKEKGFIPLEQEVWKQLVTTECYYCGHTDIRNNLFLKGKSREGYITRYTEQQMKEYAVLCNGIDRIDSSKGYEIDNCVSCCLQCNYMKHEMSQKQFYDKIEKIMSHRIYKELDVLSFITV